MATTQVEPLAGTMTAERTSPYWLDYVLAFTTLRIALAINELLHGVTRIFIGNLETFVNATQTQFQNTALPVWQVRAFATLVPWAELIIGVLLLLGLWTRWALVFAAVLMWGIIFGTAMRGDWQIVFLQMFYSLLYSVMLLWRRYDDWSLDAMMSKKSA
jgi:thiosulfate dehydrogenase [quinone] large subunit